MIKRPVLILSLVLCLLLEGCSFIRVNLSPGITPLEEEVVAGKGDHKVLMINIEGLISNSGKSSLIGGKRDVGLVEKIREILMKAEEDPEIEALVLKVNSPGGTVTSSDIIYHEIKGFREKKKIPVYAWIIDMAASGGYYISLAADKIIAHPTSITGSIGVITIKVNLKGLMDKVGVDWEIIKSGDKKDFLSPFRAITEEERRLFQNTIDDFHNRFVEIIAENRKDLDVNQVRRLADGRVFTSSQALENKLIDGIAYRDEAEEMIRKDLGVEQIKVVTYIRSGEYKTNLYSSMPDSPVINLVNVDLNFIPESPGPHFFYLWLP